MNEISGDISPEFFFIDMLAGDGSMVRKVFFFGQSNQFQPNKLSTKA